MCGLFGAIGPGINPLIIRALAIANRTRGKESLGLFDSSGKKIKSAADPTECLTRSNFSAFIERKHWFIAGHTRKATRGVANKKNAHPFRFGNYIGAHNGQCTAPINYAVDSQYLFDKLHQNHGNYIEAFKGIQGYWALTWFDGSHLYLMAHDNKLTLARKGNTWYYSSDKDHLNAAIGKADEWLTLEDGATIRFHKDGRLEKLEAFKSSAGRGGYYRAATSGYSSSSTTPAVIPGYQVPARYLPLSAIDKAREQPSGWGRDFGSDSGDGYGPSSIDHYSQRLTTNEWADAEELAEEIGYSGFADYMHTNRFYNEYTGYTSLQREVGKERDQDDEDRLYEDWDNEQCQREAEGLPYEIYEDWYARMEREGMIDCDGIDHFANSDHDDQDIMDAEFERLNDRDGDDEQLRICF